MRTSLANARLFENAHYPNHPTTKQPNHQSQGDKSMKAIRIHEIGGPEVLKLEEVPIPEPGPGEARVKLDAAGVNYIDIYYRDGRYKAQLPGIVGQEGAGVVDAAGAGVTEVRGGERVAYASGKDSYAPYAVVRAGILVPIPDDMDSQLAAA